MRERLGLKEGLAIERLARSKKLQPKNKQEKNLLSGFAAMTIFSLIFRFILNKMKFCKSHLGVRQIALAVFLSFSRKECKKFYCFALLQQEMLK